MRFRDASNVFRFPDFCYRRQAQLVLTAVAAESALHVPNERADRNFCFPSAFSYLVFAAKP